jgi:hypothetical protein
MVFAMDEKEGRIPDLIAQLERRTRSKVICFVTGDRQPIPAQIGDDAVRPLFDHLRAIGHVRRVDLFLYSRGGAIDVPWRFVTALRQSADEFRVLVPFRANSAATLLALGADAIVLGKNGELGPIDPILTIMKSVQQPGAAPTQVADPVSVEDVMSYLRFVRDRAGLSDQASLTAGLTLLANRLDAVTLGNIYRTHSHIRDVARRMLETRRNPPSAQVVGTIVESLAERVYAHGHAIGLADADAIGLPVSGATRPIDAAMWELMTAFERDLHLLEPIDAVGKLAGGDAYDEDVITAVIESASARHEHAGRLEIRAQRQMPQNLNVTVNLTMQVPQQVPGSQVNPQQILQAMQGAITQQAQQAVAEAMRNQAPIINATVAVRNAAFRRTR